jgi:hypothetical protein
LIRFKKLVFWRNAMVQPAIRHALGGRQVKETMRGLRGGMVDAGWNSKGKPGW